MATSGTFAFNEAASNLALNAFARIGIRRTEITAQHMADALLEANLLQVEFTCRQPNLFLDELYSIDLVQGQASYTIPSRMVNIQAPYITTTSGGVSTDRIIFGYSTFEYSCIPNKASQGVPTQFWYDRVVPPVIYLWPVPDASAQYVLNIRILHQFEDAVFAGGTTVAAPYRWLDAWTSGLAARLAQIYKPDMAERMDAKAERAWGIAATQDQEDVPMYIIPASISQYFR